MRIADSKAAESDYPEAQLALGKLYLSGKSVKANREKGIDLLEKAAIQVNVDAQYGIGMALIAGGGAIGVHTSLSLAHLGGNVR